MKKILLGVALSVLALQACKKDDDEEEIVALTVDEQNAYDDAAAIRYMDTHYFDNKGNIVPFSDSDTSDDNEKKLSSYNPVTLPSGVIYIIRPGAQPVNGKSIGDKDAISLMHNTKMYISTKVEDRIVFGSETPFNSSVSLTGVPVYDPAYYYVKTSVLNNYNKANNTNHDRSFYEIEGLREGLKYFTSFSMNDEEEYNLQGVIIVPSRAGFARDPNYYGLVNRSFVFNFQVYNTKSREEAGD